MTEIGESAAVIAEEQQQEDHWVKVEYTYSNGLPVEGYFYATDGDGIDWAGKLNDKGQVCLSGLPPGNVSVELIPGDEEKELTNIRKAIQQALDGIVEAEKQEAETKEAGYQKYGPAGYHVAVAKGLWDGAVGLVTFAWDTVKTAAEIAQYLSPAERLSNFLNATYKSYKSGSLTEADWRESLIKNYQDEEFKDLAELLGFDVRTLNEQKIEEIKLLITEAYEVTAFILEDSECSDLFTQFAKDYAAAQSSYEWAEFAGGGIFEIVLTALLLAFTAGIGNVAQAASKVRHVSKLKNLGTLIRKLGKLLKRKKLKKKVSVSVDSKKTVKTELPDDVKLATKAVKKLPEHKVPCFHPYDKKNFKNMTPAQQRAYLDEYAKQLRRQQDTINSMSASEFKAAREAYSANGRNPLADAMQGDLRDNFERDIKSSIRQSIRKNNPDMSIRESNEIASQKTGEIMNKLVALHEPDMVSGGYNQPDPKHMGRADVNSSIGGSWNQGGRLGGIDSSVDNAIAQGKGEHKMNLKLEVCRGKGKR